MANGQVITGFSLPYVALYAESSGTISYSSGQILARGVNVQISVDSTDANNFYADNAPAESQAGTFTGGTVTLTVDGLKQTAEKLIMGLPTPGQDGFVVYDDDQAKPYVGIGFIVRYMSGGTTTYVPIILTKCIFDDVPLEAATQEQEIDWQTTELTATILRGDDAKHTWRKVGAGVSTESAAEAVIKTAFSIT